MSSSYDDAPRRRTFFRFWFPWVVVLAAAGVVAIAATWPGESWERGGRVGAVIMTAAASFLLITLWLFIVSRRHWWMFIFILVGMAALGFTIVRDIKKDGDIVPVSVRFIWEPTHDELLEAHRQEQGGTAAAATTALPAIRATDYPEYRNRRRDGVAEGPPLKREWPTPPQPIWRQPVGGGYASFAVVGNVAITIEQRRDREAVVCYDAASGKERWVYDYPAHFQESLGGPGPRATPTVFDGHVYSLGAKGHLACLEGGSGKLKWPVNILENNDNIHWAMSGSPLVYDDVVVVNPGTQTAAAANRAVIAYDRKTGKQVPGWAAGSTQAGYCSPMLATLADKRQVLIYDAEELAGYDAASGHKLWSFPWPTYQGINVGQPIVLPDNRLFITANYNHGCAMIQVSETAGTWEAKELWKNMRMRSKFASPVEYQGYLYGLDDEHLVCIDSKDGSRKWKGNRYGKGQLLRSGDLLVVLSEQGKLALVEAKPEEAVELASFQALKGRTWNCPALANGKVYVRNDVEMACYDLTK